MMTAKYRAWMIVGVAFGLLVSSWIIATVSELLFRDRPVQSVAMVLSATSAVVGSVGLACFLGVALIEWYRYHERNTDLVSVEKGERVFVRLGNRPGEVGDLDESSVKSVCVIPALHKRAVRLDASQFAPDVYRWLVDGGNSHEHQSSR